MFLCLGVMYSGENNVCGGVTLSFYITEFLSTPGKAEIMPDHDGNQTYKPSEF